MIKMKSVENQNSSLNHENERRNANITAVANAAILMIGGANSPNVQNSQDSSEASTTELMQRHNFLTEYMNNKDYY